jgi:hypothetical protein
LAEEKPAASRRGVSCVTPHDTGIYSCQINEETKEATSPDFLPMAQRSLFDRNDQGHTLSHCNSGIPFGQNTGPVDPSFSFSVSL